jgi:hypothetical protein
MSPEPTRPKCTGQMDDGFLVDNGYGRITGSQWASGPTERSFWTGSVNLKDRRKVSVRTFRRRECGFLESYAPGGIAGERRRYGCQPIR